MGSGSHPVVQLAWYPRPIDGRITSRVGTVVPLDRAPFQTEADKKKDGSNYIHARPAGFKK